MNSDLPSAETIARFAKFAPSSGVSLSTIKKRIRKGDMSTERKIAPFVSPSSLTPEQLAEHKRKIWRETRIRRKNSTKRWEAEIKPKQV